MKPETGGAAQCNGSCEVHEGEIKKVRVKYTHKGVTTDWGFFNYCENAVKEDLSRGMIIEDSAMLAEIAKRKGVSGWKYM